ncbi:MAG: penicillin-binding protein 1A [Rhodospirillaceae bacterium]|nr:penicillin-binding protein 1A [Rhodospirillaceae bacterium]
MRPLRIILVLFSIMFLAGIAGLGGVVFVFWNFGRDLPDYQQLADYEPPVMTRVHAGDGRLLAEYATEKRVFVPIRAMPRRIINAVLSAEDKNFYSHTGVDFLSVVRAALQNVKNYGSGRRPVGASTITQQVAKNFLLTNEVSISRKVKEAILAFRIERAFSKDRILELYLNEIYLGQGSYGMAAAALDYFNKPLDQLTIAEAAFLAALPKAPNNYNPVRNPEAAKERRDWVISRMNEDGFISDEEKTEAQAEELTVRHRAPTEYVTADDFAEEIRRELADKFGENRLYKGGLSVHTTLDPRLQEIATRVLRGGLMAYDRRHGWRGPVGAIKPSEQINQGGGETIIGDFAAKLAAMDPPNGAGEWKLAVVVALSNTEAKILIKGGEGGAIPLSEMKWARKWIKGEFLGPGINKPSDVLNVGDVVLVEPVDGDKTSNSEGKFVLRQIPEIEGSLVALDPHTGRVLAMVGGFDYNKSQFNRATQAKRQPGSAFKPFVYLAALDSGFTPSTLILDAPFVIDQGPGLPKWRPANYTKQFYGPSTMRLGIEKSRNLMTVRLAETVGMEKIVEYAGTFGIAKDLPAQLSMALGAGETTLLDLTNAYAMLVNGGKKLVPTLIDRIQNRDGVTVFRHDARECIGCMAASWTGQEIPQIADSRESITDPTSAYQMVSMLEGVVERGTGRSIRAVGKPLAGKTGTTNDANDAWFLGFSPDLAVGVFTGFDEPRSLGTNEQGASVAAPIFRDFMKEALVNYTETPFRIPPGIRMVRVNPTSGLPALPGEKNVIWEAFKNGTIPTEQSRVLGLSEDKAGNPAVGTGGLY